MAIHVGDRGVTVSPLHPTGMVRVGHDRRDARSLMGPIPADADVCVVGGDAFGLIVRPSTEVLDPSQLPNYGEVCLRPEELVQQREAQADQVRYGAGWMNEDGEAQNGAEPRGFMDEVYQFVTSMAALGERSVSLIMPLIILGAFLGWSLVGPIGLAIGATLAVVVSLVILAWLVLS